MKIHKMKTFSIAFSGIFLILFTANAYGQNMFRKMMDFDGDGKADYAVTRNVGGQKVWYILQSTNGFTYSVFGLDTDEIVPGDYDGDGKFDTAVFRTETVGTGLYHYYWWIQQSRDGFGGFVLSPTIPYHFVIKPIPQVYNGDGRTKIATLEPQFNVVHVYQLDRNNISYQAPAGQFVKTGDLTGDGKADFSSFDANTHFLKTTAFDGSTTSQIYFGDAGDVFVPADFDGDGRGEIVLWRPSTGTWWYIKSSDNTVNGVNWGTAGDVPVPADYDGDGKTDVAIWRGGTQSYFWVNGSQNGIFSVAWGIASDSVVKY
ncbi:MAG: VCBS repeat-containing protein [Pyrinomonadaceae bacterium]|nr:VCBS repeat-containing protein [Pyrinomonadaceae bacterium]